MLPHSSNPNFACFASSTRQCEETCSHDIETVQRERKFCKDGDSKFYLKGKAKNQFLQRGREQAQTPFWYPSTAAAIPPESR
ncbi:hypothetical protein OPV22_027520 [Ensete ventricosum]|uniref:Uncharacterized protein n=1 Tax=Ensete ventricosum TaxID=4639 RepID=A0AAV8Q3Y0_ENSVE|nr:hypothetical protein OPV22_027520 [Ensete ventricosum]